MQECHDLVKQLSAKKAGGTTETKTKEESGPEKPPESDDFDGTIDMLAKSGDSLAVEDPDMVAAKTHALSEFDHVHPFTSAADLKAALSRDVPCPFGDGGSHRPRIMLDVETKEHRFGWESGGHVHKNRT